MDLSGVSCIPSTLATKSNFFFFFWAKVEDVWDEVSSDDVVPATTLSSLERGRLMSFPWGVLKVRLRLLYRSHSFPLGLWTLAPSTVVRSCTLNHSRATSPLKFIATLLAHSLNSGYLILGLLGFSSTAFPSKFSIIASVSFFFCSEVRGEVAAARTLISASGDLLSKSLTSWAVLSGHGAFFGVDDDDGVVCWDL